MSTNRMVGALLALASGKAERSPSLTTLLVLPDSNSFLYFRSKTSRKVQWFYGKKAYYIAVR